jgi:hypothetical protein
MAIQFANNAATTLFSSVLMSDTQIIVSPGGGALFPVAGGSSYFMVTVVDTITGLLEIMKVTNRSGDTFTVVRAQEGTTARAFPSGSPVELRLTAQSILDAIDVKIPRGIITMWSGAVDAVPSGWHLCDGTNGTPDLRDRFIVAAGNSYSPGYTGGSLTYTPTITVNGSGTGVQVGYHTLTIAEMPSHNHTLHIYQGGDSAGGRCTDYGGRSYIQDDACLPTGGNQGHNHPIVDYGHVHSASASAIDSRPPYYALAFIMKL